MKKMPSKKKKYNARFPPVSLVYVRDLSCHDSHGQIFTLYFFQFQARIKKIMQTDEDVGKVAAAVPVIICILCLFFVNLIIFYTPGCRMKAYK